MDNSIQKRAFTIPEFCKAYGPGKTQTYKEIAEGRLKARKFGAKNLILLEDAEAWARGLPESRPAEGAAS